MSHDRKRNCEASYESLHCFEAPKGKLSKDATGMHNEDENKCAMTIFSLVRSSVHMTSWAKREITKTRFDRWEMHASAWDILFLENIESSTGVRLRW